jgi:putative SOS response-associated peptidase YedK
LEARPDGPRRCLTGAFTERLRCLIAASRFYEFTGTKLPESKQQFTKTGEDSRIGSASPSYGGR